MKGREAKMKKYVVRNRTMEEAGFGLIYSSDYFNSYEEALKEIDQREYTDRVVGVYNEYYIREVGDDE